MRKIVSVVMTALLFFSLFACGNREEQQQQNNGNYVDNPDFRPYIVTSLVLGGTEVKEVVLICGGINTACWHEALFSVLKELNIGYLEFSPLANGFLSAQYGKASKFDSTYDYRSVMPQFSNEEIEQNRTLLELLHRAAQEKERPRRRFLLHGYCVRSHIW